MAFAERTLAFELPTSITLKKTSIPYIYTTSVKADVQETYSDGTTKLLKDTEVTMDFEPTVSGRTGKALATIQMAAFLKNNLEIAKYEAPKVSVAIQALNLQSYEYDFKELSDTRALLTFKYGENQKRKILGVGAPVVAAGSYSNKAAAVVLYKSQSNANNTSVSVKYAPSFVGK